MEMQAEEALQQGVEFGILKTAMPFVFHRYEKRGDTRLVERRVENLGLIERNELVLVAVDVEERGVVFGHVGDWRRTLSLLAGSFEWGRR